MHRHLQISILALTALVALLSCSDNGTNPPMDTTSPARVTDLAVVSSGDHNLTIQWTAPGDDGRTGTAKSYKVRWSLSAINAGNFSGANVAANPPAPKAAGTVQQFTVTGLDTTLVTHFALKAVDEAGNSSQVSNDAVWNPTGDTTAPARITDLAVISAGASSLTIQWTAPGDDNNTGAATSYAVRWSHSAITQGNFASATLAVGPPAPAVAGTVQQFTITGLDTTLVTHLAMTATDDVNNVSLVSNDAVWTPVNPPQHLVKDIPPFKDNTMYQEDGSTSNGAGQHLFTGRTAGTSGTLSRRALVAFAIADSLPAGAAIDSVQLTLHVSKVPTATARVVKLFRVTADWGEGTSVGALGEGAGAPATTGDATWTFRFFNTQSWASAGGDFVAGASAQTPVMGNGFYVWRSVQMKTDVQSWLDTPANNFGWVVVGDESIIRTAKRFDSRENTTVANRPRLRVFYTVP